MGDSVREEIDRIEAAEGGKPCPACGAPIVIRHTIITYRFSGNGVYESLVSINCSSCGIGRQLSITRPKP
jgi:RNase P subunit RPR2